MKEIHISIFVIILLIAVCVRLYRLDSVPPSLNWDEAAIGWNSYSLWKTHLDEYGTKWPLVFKSFGDYKAPGLFYITAPFVGLLGPTPFTVRLPSALAGIVTVLVIYFLAREIGKYLLFTPKQIKIFSIVSMALLAVSPWHLLFSRVAYEPNVALFFTTVGIYFAILSLRKPYLWLVSGLSFVASLYTYHSPKIFLPIFIIGFLLIFFKETIRGIWKYRWVSLCALIVLILSLRPLIESNLHGLGAARFNTSIFYDDNSQLKQFSVATLVQIGKNVKAHLNPSFYLVGNDENYRLSLKNFGLMPSIEWILFIAGFIILIRNWKNKGSKFILLWFISGLIPAALGRQVPHSLRSLNSLPSALMIAGYAVVILIAYLNNKINKYKLLNKITLTQACIVLCGALFIIQTSRYFYEYYYRYPVYAASDWQYGYKQAVEYAQSKQDEVEKIIFSNKYGQAYVFTYLFQKREPMNVLWGEMRKYTFRDFKWDSDKFEKKSLLIGAGDEIPDQVPPEIGKIVKEISSPNGEVVFRIVQTL